MTWITYCFWISVCIVFYAFLGYGFILYTMVLLKRLFGGTSINEDPLFEPEITLVIPCFNEAETIESKIINSKKLDYPAHKLTIIFITDGSTDNSNLLLSKWPEVKVLHQQKRAGKTAAENRAMLFVQTPFVIFSDANTMLNTAAVKNIVRHFADETVGCVSGEKRIITSSTDSASAAGEGIYWKYESLLKRLDSELYSSVGAAGELVAFRSSLYAVLPDDTILDDFMQSMQMAAAGYKIRYEPEAYAVETASENIQEEYKRKVRICAGGWQSISRLSQIMSLRKTPLLYFQYFSHRVLRWTVTPFLLLAIFILNLLMVQLDSRFAIVMLVAQVFFYGAAAVGFVLENKKLRFKPVFVPYYFCMMNYAVLAGLIKYLSGKQSAVWEKALRKPVSVNH